MGNWTPEELQIAALTQNILALADLRVITNRLLKLSLEIESLDVTARHHQSAEGSSEPWRRQARVLREVIRRVEEVKARKG